MGQIKCKNDPPPSLFPPKLKCVCAPLPVFGCVVTPLVIVTVMSLLPPSPLSVSCLSAVLVGLSNRAQFFLKKEKSLLSRSEMR